MADIRINALATTATTSASDDYIAIDGSANGTRKLSVYSPTFGGNLTVSGAASLLGSTNSTSIADVETTAALIARGSTTPRLYLGNENAANRPFLQAGTAGSALFMILQPYGGNVLLGSLTDSSNGRLQLATHTTSAGGIGFGTDTSLYRVSSTDTALNTAGSNTFGLYTGGVRKAYFNWNNTSNFLAITAENAGSSLLLGSAGTTALTLDSSQNATFSGTKIALASGTLLGMTGTAAALTSTNFALYGDATQTFVNVATGGTTQLRVNNTQIFGVSSTEATVASGIALKLGNAYVAGAPSATGYVTIKDAAGVTYKVLVST